MCPPRIMAKDSALLKRAAPGIMVMVSLPALISSGSISSSVRIRADAEQAVLRLQHQLMPGGM